MVFGPGAFLCDITQLYKASGKHGTALRCVEDAVLCIIFAVFYCSVAVAVVVVGEAECVVGLFCDCAVLTPETAPKHGFARVLSLLLRSFQRSVVSCAFGVVLLVV